MIFTHSFLLCWRYPAWANTRWQKLHGFHIAKFQSKYCCGIDSNVVDIILFTFCDSHLRLCRSKSLV
jgi:hypothetical protein